MSFTRTRKIVSGLALAAIVSLAAVAGLAQDGGQGQGGEHAGRHRGHKGGGRGMRGGDFGGRFFGRLNLTDAQKEQMRQISERHHQSMQSMRERGRGTRGEGPAAFDGTFNESAVRAAAQARANARVEMEVARARMMHEMYNVLTAEQKAQLAAERQQRQQRRQERRQRRQAGDQL
ncbi:MAG TPA: Spy/CpxP family protein refolding chaperone [Pyrinomonadaceae bacterium]|nr:Spy/CpxP family protein refolding chaperone [Pyrinomonadaceae bacterium]